MQHECVEADDTNDHRFEHVELEVSVAASDCDGHVVPHHLSSHHGHGLTLRGIHFTCFTHTLLLLYKIT